MKFEDIKAQAEKEVSLEERTYKIERLKKTQKQYPKGCDIDMDSTLIEIMEPICDSIGIPFYRVTHNTVSIAATYRDLYNHEIIR